MSSRFKRWFLVLSTLLILYRLKSNESKVRVASANAIGNMSAVLPKEQLEGQLSKLVPVLLALIKKEKEQLPITQALSILFSVVTKSDTSMLVLQPLLQPIFQTIHPLACLPFEFDDATKVKNYNELLRCWEILARAYSDALPFLLSQFQSKDARTRIGTLAIIRHLINRLGRFFIFPFWKGSVTLTHFISGWVSRQERAASFWCEASREWTCSSGIYQLLAVISQHHLPLVKVKKSLAQVIIAMASHNYLSLEGGESLVEFIVRHCAVSDADIAKANAAAAKERAGNDKSDCSGIR